MTLEQNINREFRIRINWDSEPGSRLRNYKGLVVAIGPKLAEKLSKKALASKVYQPTFRLRRGVRIDFSPK